jgi:acyl-CoA synthetase (AMP-forming)/AMP-acid ligase II
MQPSSRQSLWTLLSPAGSVAKRVISDDRTTLRVGDLYDRTSLGGRLAELRGLSVMIATVRQLPTVLALVELDGIARRVVVCTPDLAMQHIPSILAGAEVDAVVTDETRLSTELLASVPIVPSQDRLDTISVPIERHTDTEWVLFTSGTMGQPKMVRHSLASLAGPMQDGLAVTQFAVWSTFYDVRRYGGLQILLRALMGGGSMILSSPDEPVAAFLARAGQAGVTHISGTPSHWRRALIGGATDRIAPHYVRLSGEIADQAILDTLRRTYPDARVAHAFASTEGGVAFDVRDNLAGFPASLIDPGSPLAQLGISMIVKGGTLRIRSSRVASGYLGVDAACLHDAGGYIDTGDVVELRGDRYYFVGRKEGIINVGGLKVHPEEVEAVINRNPLVRMSRVRARTNPITGAIVSADVVLEESVFSSRVCFEQVRQQILDDCRQALPAHKIPVTLRAVESLGIAASGKLARTNA